MPPVVAAVLLLLTGWLLLSWTIEALAWAGWRLGNGEAPASFRAPPRRLREGVARLAFLGDLQRGVADVARPLARTLAEDPVDLLVSSGDLVAHGEAPYYGVLFDAFEAAGIDTPARVVPGNHDLQPRGVRDAAAGRDLFGRAFGGGAFLETVGPVLVAGLDTALGPVGDASLEALDRALAEDPARPWILVCHRPLRRLQHADAPAEPDLASVVERVEARPPSSS